MFAAVSAPREEGRPTFYRRYSLVTAPDSAGLLIARQGRLVHLYIPSIVERNEIDEVASRRISDNRWPVLNTNGKQQKKERKQYDDAVEWSDLVGSHTDTSNIGVECPQEKVCLADCIVYLDNIRAQV